MYCFSNFVHTCSIMFIHCASIGMFSQPSPLHRIPPRSWWNASSRSQGSRHPNSPGESHGSRRPGPGPAPHPRRHPATEGAAAGHTTQATGGAHPGAQGRNAHQARTNTYPKRSNDQKGTDTHQKRAKCEERSYTYQAWAHVHRAFAELFLCDAVWRVFQDLSGVGADFPKSAAQDIETWANTYQKGSQQGSYSQAWINTVKAQGAAAQPGWDRATRYFHRISCWGLQWFDCSR